jgi:hypothetical protein
MPSIIFLDAADLRYDIVQYIFKRQAQHIFWATCGRGFGAYQIARANAEPAETALSRDIWQTSDDQVSLVDMSALAGKRVSFKLQPNFDSSNIKISRLTNLATSSIPMTAYLDVLKEIPKTGWTYVQQERQRSKRGW